MAPSVNPTVRRYILTGSFAAVTITGAWYGAGLKIQQEFSEEKRAVQEITTEQKIEQLEMIKSRYVEQSREMQEKIDQLQEKIKKKSQESPQKTL